LRLYTHTHTHTGDCLLENKNTNNAEHINNNTKFNKDRTMPIFNNGIGLSLFAFVKEKNVSRKLYHTCYIDIKGFGDKFLRMVRAGP